MACTDINNFLQTEADRISSQTMQKPWVGSVWDGQDIVRNTTWPNNMGESINFLVYERSMPLTNDITMTTVGFNDGGGGDASGTCAPTTVVVHPAVTSRSMTLKKGAVESAPLCIEDGRMSWNTAQQMEQVLRNIKGVVKHGWQNFRRDEFATMCSNKAIANDAMTTSSSSFAVTTVGELKKEMLDYWYYKLTQDGAHENSGIPTHYGQPVLPLSLSPEAQKTLTRSATTIDNLRWGSEADRLSGPAGSFKLLDGFAHMIDIQARRWNLTDGAWVRVPFLLPATTAGEKASVNPDYQTATYEDLIIPHRDVLKFAIPTPNLSLGSGVTFKPTEYNGNFRWKNTEDNDCNPDGTIGKFRGILGYGAQPGIPEYGVVLRFRRCPTSWTVSQCS